MPNPRLVSLCIIFILIFLFPDPTPTPLGSFQRLNNTITREKTALGLLNRTSYGDFDPAGDRWLDIPGLREQDGFAWHALKLVKERVKEQVAHILGTESQDLLEGKGRELTIYHNVTGRVRGRWVRSKLDESVGRPHLNMTAILPSDARFEHSFLRNITGNGGQMQFDFKSENQIQGLEGPGTVQNVRADAVFADETSTGDGWTTVLYGVQFVHTGHILLTTSSEKFAGIFALPHFALSENLFSGSKRRLVETLKTILREQKAQQNMHPWSSTIDGAADNAYTPHCNMIVYLQQHRLPIAPASPQLIQVLEHELRFPNGHRSMVPPRITMSALVFSPDCGFLLESQGPPDYTRVEGNHLQGERWEIRSRTSVHHALLFAAALGAQVLLTMTQMRHSSTPSTRSRISVYTIGIISLGDGFISMVFFSLGMLSDTESIALFATAFFAVLAILIFDTRFLIEIWSVQAQEELDQARRRATRASVSTAAQEASLAVPIITAAGADSLPLPVNSREVLNSGAIPIILPPDQDEPANEMPPTATTAAEDARRELGTLYGKMYLLLLAITFLSLHATSWHPSLRSLYTNVLSFAYLSLWVPQIYRNTMRNCRKALLWKFVIGQSALRLEPVAYFYTKPDNVLWVQNDTRTFLAIAAWLWIQILLLAAQEFFGPRLFIPASWVPPAYDYHPLLREDEEESKMPIGFTHTSADDSPHTKDKGKRVFDCAICMLDIEVSVVPASGGGGGDVTLGSGFLGRRAYMVTPCRHIFHTECLEAAMRYRLQCPICRESLPPL
ncbi:hypothetical protein EJ08DRAFT_609138 [Tothia fuscella]|uniref:DSC E3 ubiquitin ligase complex subunit A n=1 Tax=Tothia fuscella TaxID=1048955 RepID=A0A9P4U056_9PEZI|nr:hypothetical protein EJ08DRAFT_609138 [Tothia fuscella]